MTTIASGSASITDNWLLQSSAEVLERAIDPGARAEWLKIDTDGALSAQPISIGVMQILSLASLIEQIVFCDTLHVMSKWTVTWARESKQLQTLIAAKIVREFDAQNDDLRNRTQEYQRVLCKTPKLLEISQEADLAFRYGRNDFVGQVLNGCSPYLAQSDVYNYCYSPHPVRARFLEQVLYKSHRSLNPIQKLNQIVNTTRVKLSEQIGYDSAVTTLVCKISSIAMLCLRESSQQSLPILTALQIRDADEFRRLRAMLHEMQLAIVSDNESSAKAYLDRARMLEAAISEVERSLKLRELGDRDGFSEITVWKGLKVRVPDALRRPVIPPRHTTAINRLVVTAKADIRRILDRSLGITDPQIIEELQSFLNHTDETGS